MKTPGTSGIIYNSNDYNTSTQINSVQELETRPIKELEILFKNQSFENDVLTIHKGSFGETDVFLLKKEDKVVVRSEILF